MAKIQEEVIVVTLSKLVKYDDTTTDLITDDLLEAITSLVESATESLLGKGVVVEVTKT